MWWFSNNDLGAAILTAYEGLKGTNVSEFFVTLLNTFNLIKQFIIGKAVLELEKHLIMVYHHQYRNTPTNRALHADIICRLYNR
jgi:hypothetical protein